MNPVHVRRDDLHLGSQLAALTVSADGRRVYVGRGLSDDQGRENVAVLDVDPVTGTLLGKRLLRDSDAPLPVAYLSPVPARPRASVTAVVASARFGKLYVASSLEDPAARPRRLLTVYDLDAAGVPVPASLRTYRADADGFAGPVAVEQLVLNPVAPALYLTGGGWAAVRHHPLDATGEPVGDQPVVLPVPGSPVPSLAVNAAGTRLYLGRAARTLTVLRLGPDGAPTLTGAGTLGSALPGVALGGDGYLRVAATPRALYALRGLPTLTGAARARPVPLHALPLDAAGDPAAADWQVVPGYDHVVLAADPAGDRLWLAEETVHGTEPDGYQLAAYALGAGGLPGAEVERGPRRWRDQPVLAAVGPGGHPAVLDRPGALVDHAAGETVRFRVRRTGPAGPTTYAATLFGQFTGASEPFTVADGALSGPVLLDEFLLGQPDQVPLRLRFAPTAVPGAEYVIEAHWTPTGGTPLVRTDTVRGQDVYFLLPGYAVTPPATRAERFEAFSEHWKAYRKAAEAVALRPDERPEKFVVSAYAVAGGQGHRGQLEDGLAALRALGINSVQLGNWQGIPAAELAAASAGLSPESGTYAPPLHSPFLFAYDGSLTDTVTGKVIDRAYLTAWAEKAAAAVRDVTGVSPGRVTRFQLADEPGWYLPGVFGQLDPADPVLPANQKVRWTDGTVRNAAWVRRFAAYLAEVDPGLVAELGDDWTGRPVGAGSATTPALRRLFRHSTRFFVAEATAGMQVLHDELQSAFGAERAPDPRSEHDELHVHVNFGGVLDWQWHKPYPGQVGDKNPDSGPDAATGSYDWHRLGRETGVHLSSHSYQHDAGAQVWSFNADLLRSAAGPDGAFTAFVPGSRLGDLPSGAAYKVGSVVARGAKMVTAYAFGPEFLFLPPNSWAGNEAAYAPLADALRLVGGGQDVLHPGRPEPARVAIHLPAGSRLWDTTQAAPAYYREVLPLHTALVHDGYEVDLVDDDAIAAGLTADVLFLTGPNLTRAAQRAVAAWTRAGGTLVALPAAATRDEFDAPTTDLDALLGVTGRAWAGARTPVHPNTGFALNSTLAVADKDWRAALRTDALPLRDLVGLAPVLTQQFAPLTAAGARVLATLAGSGAPAVTRNAAGAGRAYAYAFFPGWQYWCSATHPAFVNGVLDLHTDRLPRGWSDRDRLLATLPVRLADVPRPVRADRGAVEVRRLSSAAGTAVVLFNWTGAAIDDLRVEIDGTVGRVRSVRRGPLTPAPRPGGCTVRLPLADVDVLVLDESPV